MDANVVLFLVALVGAGLFAGFVGGLFGIGGGIVIVPALHALFLELGVGEEIAAHCAIATSLSTIIATSLRSLSAHHKAGAVDHAALKSFLPWVTLGAIMGTGLAGLSDGRILLGLFAGLALVVGANMVFGRPDWRLMADLPKGVWRILSGGAIGALSAMVGVGGGALGGMLMTLSGRPIHQAVATASGFGVAIALPATIGYAMAGWGKPGLPPFSLGYVNAPGFAILAALTVLTAPFGARLAHRLDQKALKRVFAAFLALMAGRMMLKALGY